MASFFGNDEEGESSEDDSNESAGEITTMAKGLGARGLDFMADEESSDDENREILGRKDKAHKALTEIVTAIRLCVERKDFTLALVKFAKLVKLEKKHKKDVKDFGFPESYIKNLAKLRTKVNQDFKANKKDKKYVTKDQSKSLSDLKVKKTDKLLMYHDDVKKFMKENEEDLQASAALTESEDETSSDEDAGSSDDEDPKSDVEDEKVGSGDESGEEGQFRIGGSGADDDDAEEEWDSESDWGDSDSDSEGSDIPKEITDDLLERMKKREFWVKENWEDTIKTDAERLQENIQKRQDASRKQAEKDQKAAARREKKRLEREKHARYQEEQSKKWKNIKIKLKKILVERNRAGVDRMEIIEKLRDVADKLSKDKLYSNTLLTVKVILVNCLLDMSLNKLTGLPRNIWLETVDEIKEVLRIMNTQPDGVSGKPLRLSQWVDLRITDDHDEPDDDEEEKKQDISVLDEVETKPHRDDIDVDDDTYSYVHGNLWAFLQRLSDQLALSLKNAAGQSAARAAPCNTPEYKSRQADENVLLEVLEQAQQYFLDFKDKTGEIDCALCRMSFLYVRYIASRDNVGQTRAAPPLGRFGPSPILQLDDTLELVKLARLVFSYNSNDEHTRRIRAILTQFPPPNVINPSKDDEHAHIMASCKVADGWYSIPLVKVGLQGFKQVNRQREADGGWYRTGEVGTIYLSSGGEKDEFLLHQEDVKDILLSEAMPADGEKGEKFWADIKRFHGKTEGFKEAAEDAVKQLQRDGATTFKFTVENDGTRFLNAEEPDVEQLLLEQNSTLYTLYSELCQALLKSKPKAAYGETRALQACLYLVYNQALHNNFYVARDLLQMSQLTASIYAYGNQTTSAPKILRYDIKTTQVLFNRTIARLAISAFANGEWSNCMKILQELYGTRKIKELLAQGSGQRMDNLTDEELAKETKRRVPTHLHMELEVLESCHLISAMFFEIPMIVNYPNDDFGRHSISRSFRRNIWDRYIQKAHEQFMGPPETVRDHVFRAGMEMKEGNWKQCFGYLKQLDFWEKLSAKEQAGRLVEREVKKQSLRCFLLMHGPQYCALSIKSLGDRFDMSERDLHMWISHLIESKDDKLRASWDMSEGANCLVVHSEPASRLQKALVSYTDKLHQLVEVNEELAKVGGYNSGQRRGYNRNRNVLQRAANRNKGGGGRFNQNNKNNKNQRNTNTRRPNKPNNSGRFGR